MKNLNENQKVTLTIGQLKKLVNEAMITDEEKRYFDNFASRLAASVIVTLKNMRELDEPENARTNANDFMHKLVNTIDEFDVEALPRGLIDAAEDVIYNVFDKPV